MKLHLVGLPHTQTVVEEMTVCAFTQKVVKFGEMMTPLGYDIVLYSGEHNDTICSEHVPVFTDEDQRSWYGDHDPNLLPTVAKFDVALPMWVQMNHRAIAEISKRIEPGDLILLLAGLAQKPIADAFPNNYTVEWAAGYDGIFAPFVCFESYAWRHYLYGRYLSNGWGGEGRWYDTVIPNYFRRDDFALADEDPGDYLLFVGRVTKQKGVETAMQIAVASGRKLIVAGPGVASSEPGRIVANEGFELRGDVEYAGVADVKTRNELMAGAHAILVPSYYIEPFGAVNVEAQLCGTPAIAPDWGAFTETIEHGVTGFRFRTLAEAVTAVDAAGALDREAIRARALDRYSLEAIGPQYDRWFRQLDDLHREGWYEGTIYGEAKKLRQAAGGAVSPGIDLDIGVMLGSPPALAAAPESAQNGREPVYAEDPNRPHLGGYIPGGDPATFCPELWEWIVRKEKIRSVLDLGCGEGHALRYFQSLGCTVLGIDGIPQGDPSIIEHDFTLGPVDLRRNKFDLCWCCEFVEHVPADHEPNFVKAMKACKLVLMTHAVPGQPGHHHVNCQEPSYWKGLLGKAGFSYSPQLTKAARARCQSEDGNHFARSGLAFRKVR